MHLGINNSYCNYQNNHVAFGARFSKEDIETLIQHTSSKNIPQLYTCLERLDELNYYGDKVRLRDEVRRRYNHKNPRDHELHDYHIRSIIADWNYLLYSGDNDDDYFFVLKNLILDGTNCEIGMPQSIYEQTVWSHRNVAAKDLYKFAIDA